MNGLCVGLLALFCLSSTVVLGASLELSKEEPAGSRRSLAGGTERMVGGRGLSRRGWTRRRRAIQQVPPLDPKTKLTNVVLDLAVRVPPPVPTTPNVTLNGTGQNGTNLSVETRAGGVGLPERFNCYLPNLDPMSVTPKLKYEYSDKPPCPEVGPEEAEPIPYANYRGTKGYGEECRLHYEVNEEQVKGYSAEGGYQTTTNVYDKDQPGSPDNTLNRKLGKVEDFTCNKDLFLECYPTVLDYWNQDGEFVGGTGVCKCMAAFGRHVDQRLVINNKCYVPAGLGRHSECITDDVGVPLPSGDALYEPTTWNAIRLPCTPNSVCTAHHYWTEKRCKCDKYTVADPILGTCGDPNASGTEKLRFGISVLLALLLPPTLFPLF